MPNTPQPDPPVPEPEDREPVSQRDSLTISDPQLAGDLVDDDDASPGLQLDMTADMLDLDNPEADDGQADDDQAESIYAASSYPGIPIRYRAERLDAATINSSSRSLYVEDLDYVHENGRRYCGDYIFPNDELEQDRLRVMHQVFLQVFDLKPTSVQLDNPNIILDIGTGTGEWAINMGEQYPECEIIGVDISAIQPSAVPHNVFFEIDDCEIEWMRPDDTIDLVHMRDMAGAISDWDFVFREALTCLKPGGYVEVLDFHDHTSAKSFLSCFPPEAQIHAFARAVDEASIKAGRRRGTHHMDVESLQRMGYVDVHVRERSIPFNPLVNSVAKLWLIACLHTIEATSLRLLTKYLEWEPEEAFRVCDGVCQEIKDKALEPDPSDNLKITLHLLTARKPTVAEAAEIAQLHDMEMGDATSMLLNPMHGAAHDDHSGHETSTSTSAD